MLQEYRHYIMNLRNNLIRCGVEYPITSLERYEDLFQEASRLEQVLWYYSVMGISNSSGALSDYFIPLTGYYKEKLRERCYTNFQEFFDNYKKISALAAITQSGLVSSRIETELQSDGVDLFESDESEDTSIVEESNNSQMGTISTMLSQPHGVFLEDVFNTVTETVSHGVFLDEISNFFPKPSCGNVDNGVYLSIESRPYGVYLEDVIEREGDESDWVDETSESVDDIEEDVYDEGLYGESYGEFGTSNGDDYLSSIDEDDLPDETSESIEDEEEYEDYSDFNEDDLPDEISETVEDEDEYSDDEYLDEDDLPDEVSETVDDEDEYTDEGYLNEDDLSDEISETVEDDEYSEDDYLDESELPDEISETVEDDEYSEDEYLDEDDLPDEISETVEDDEDEYADDEYLDEDDLPDEISETVDDEDEYSEDDYLDEDDLPDEISETVEDDEYDEGEYLDEDDLPDEISETVDDEDEDSYSPPKNTEPVTSQNKGVSQQPKQSKDLSDYLQNATNSLLTSGKRFLVKETRKLKNG